jgi:hypothetical protein
VVECLPSRHKDLDPKHPQNKRIKKSLVLKGGTGKMTHSLVTWHRWVAHLCTAGNCNACTLDPCNVGGLELSTGTKKSCEPGCPQHL